MACHVFRRTWGGRLVPVLLAGGAAALLLAEAVAGRLQVSWWTGGVAAVGLLALVAALLAWGDRVTVDAVGLHMHNGLLQRLGRGPRTLPWGRMCAVHPFYGLPRAGRCEGGAHAPRALFVIPDEGRRWVLDSLQEMDRLQVLLEARLAPDPPCGKRPTL